MNLFVTYGVRGRMLSGRAFFEQIRERTNDIRQTRIAGYPRLGDYLERRVAQGIRDVERVAERYDYLRGRVQAYYNGARTKVNSSETSGVEGFVEGMDVTMKKMNETVGVLDQTTKIATDILLVTEVLIALSLVMVLYLPIVELLGLKEHTYKVWVLFGLLMV